MPPVSLLAAVVALTGAAPEPWTPTAAQAARLERGDIVVTVGPGPELASGLIHGAVDIRAPRHRVWDVIADCADAPHLLGYIKACRIIRSASDGAWDVREAEVDYGFPLPPVRSVIRSEYDGDRRIDFRCLAGGQVKACAGEWRLAPNPDGTVRVTYDAWLASPLPLPPLLVRGVLRMAVANALRTLRREATAVQ